MDFLTLFRRTAYACFVLISLYAQPVIVENVVEQNMIKAGANLKNDIAISKAIDKEIEKSVIVEKPKVYKKVPLLYTVEDSEYRFAFKFRPEFFYGNHLRMLDIPGNRIDEILYMRHTIDFIGEYHYGKASHGHDVTMFKFDLRNRGIWGDAESIAATTESPIKRLDTITAEHRHGIPRHLLWIRELWLQMTLNDIFSFPWCNQHTFTIGSFPFEVGRGIALGSAYGIGPDLLGYYAEQAIDQYAFGAKLSGDWVKDTVGYDIYAEIADNRSSSFDHVTAKIRGQEYGRQFNPVRDFGIINYIIAARLRFTPKFRDLKDTSLYFEPYVVFNDQREQKLEFTGDSHAHVITPGISGEFTFGNFGFGFDTALNFGGQKVKGFDRNTIGEQNRNGYEVIVNSKVNQIAPDGTKDLALRTDANQKIIAASRVHEGELQNGAVIGSNSLGTLVNADDRFRDPYSVKFRGAMAVVDMGYYICNPELRLNLAFGFASGDENPHKTIDNDDEDYNYEYTYEGFIGLQEVYAGTRVKSAFLLAGPGKVPRILSFPAAQLNNPYPSIVSRFTNLIFTGGSAQLRLGGWHLNPNILSYWQDCSTRYFFKDKDGCTIDKCADSHLGTEFNIFAERELVQDLRFFFVGALFHPGKHFTHIADNPLNKDQHKYRESIAKAQDKAAKDCIEKVPQFKVCNAYFLNFGLEYKF